MRINVTDGQRKTKMKQSRRCWRGHTGEEQSAPQHGGDWPLIDVTTDGMLKK